MYEDRTFRLLPIENVKCYVTFLWKIAHISIKLIVNDIINIKFELFYL